MSSNKYRDSREASPEKAPLAMEDILFESNILFHIQARWKEESIVLADEDFCTNIKARLSRPENAPLTSDVILLAVKVLGLKGVVQAKQATYF